MNESRIIIVGGGAAGFFAAITCAERLPGASICLLEKSAHFLSKVRISGGGRCNVTHACFEPSELINHYPRGGAALRGAFQRFQPRNTIEWFESRRVKLKTEADGRMFPVTDSSQTILDCLIGGARKARVEMWANEEVRWAKRLDVGGFELETVSGRKLTGDKLMLATGGCRGAGAGSLAASLGHTLESPVPSLFAFNVAAPWLTSLAGISLPEVELSVPGTGLKDHGAMLLTHSGLSGPAILKLSAWGARQLHGCNYRFRLRVNWVPGTNPEQLTEQLERCRSNFPARQLANTPFPPLPARLWQALADLSGGNRETRWAELSRSIRHQLVQQLTHTEVEVVGKTLNQDEFVTCGGVRLSEVDFKTMESRICPGLYFGGELLDVDALTGGFNFQAAWTTGWIAGTAMSED